MCIFSSLELNLWDYAWSTDIYMGIIATICSSIYFKNKIPSFISYDSDNNYIFQLVLDVANIYDFAPC